MLIRKPTRVPEPYLDQRNTPLKRHCLFRTKTLGFFHAEPKALSFGVASKALRVNARFHRVFVD